MRICLRNGIPLEPHRIMNPTGLVVIAASRGGFTALRTLVADFPRDFPAAVCVVLHIGRHKSSLPELLRKWGPLPASHAKDGEALQAGRIYVAPPDRHLVVEPGRLHLSDSAPENFSRPAADPLFRSAAVSYGRRVVGVVLSGDLDDGAAGLAMVRARGGHCLVQSPDECEAPSMPTSALEAVGGDARVAAIESMAAAIVRALQTEESDEARLDVTSGKESAMSTEQFVEEEEARLAARGFVAPHELDGIGRRSALTCPECGGSLWQMDSDRPQRYRCHTGHAFTGLSLEDGLLRDMERALWQAVRAVKEHALFAHEQKLWVEQHGIDACAASEIGAASSAQTGAIAQDESLEAILRAALKALARKDEP